MNDDFKLDIFTAARADLYLAYSEDVPWNLVRRVDEAGICLVGDLQGPEPDDARVRQIMSGCSGLVTVASQEPSPDVLTAMRIGTDLGIPIHEVRPDAAVPDLKSDVNLARPYAFVIGRLERDFALARQAIRVAVERDAGISCLWADDGRHRTNIESIRERTRLLIRHATLVIAELTLGVESPDRENPSRAHEIGMAVAYDRRLVLTSQEPRRYPYFSIGDRQMTFWDTEDELEETVGCGFEHIANPWPDASSTTSCLNPGSPRRRLPMIRVRDIRTKDSATIDTIGWGDRARSWCFGMVGLLGAPRIGRLMKLRCVYCLDNHELRADQILLRGQHFYVCAPRGQLVEGFLVIAPYDCVGCLAILPRMHIGELARMHDLVVRFYRETYQVAQGTFYEQGRAGGGAAAERVNGFPLHAHLCCLLLSAPLNDLLGGRYLQKTLSGINDLADGVGGEPYIYFESGGTRSVYVARSDQGRVELEKMRLKPQIAALLGLPERGHWRDYHGDLELARLVLRFAEFLQWNVI